MTPNNMAGLETEIYAVSDPKSKLYGQHLTAEEVSKIFEPTDETLSTVGSWLSQNNITYSAVSPAGDIIQFTIPVAQANDLLATQFSIYTHVETGKTIICTLEYSIPAALHGQVVFVHPTTTFTRPMAARPKFHAVGLKREALYGIPTTPATQTTNRLGVSGFIEQFANQADLMQFLTTLRPDMSPMTTFTLQTLDGGVKVFVQCLANAMASVVSVGENNSDGVDGFIDIINSLLAQPAGTRPKVLSTSYGFDETDLSRPCSLQHVRGTWRSRNFGLVFIWGRTAFVPTLPSDCPFVTSVSATAGITETAATFSSGGFSNYFNIPSYQALAVAAYLATIGATNSGKFNRTGRGFPDVAAQGQNFEIVWDAQFGAVSGTSTSAPTFASIIALLNDELIAAGKPPLGLLNPLLYSAPETFTDITSGNNPGCNTQGFSATRGWDPITGLGTPNYARLKALVLPSTSPGSPTLPQAGIICDPNTNRCFNQYHSATLNVTSGFALPPAGSGFVNEALLYNISFALRVTGVFLGAQSASSSASGSGLVAANYYIPFPPQQDFTPHDCEAEATMLG
ncbi:family S53 protease [Mycena albidolilacea]|uniref:Family S53 protease n=1 Tax=Mycena albidolilacea TaxID=1033008 RepID=A0AAD6ZAN9_9AGAR|nr:family S53 protease [Mycena albidolilacea]